MAVSAPSEEGDPSTRPPVRGRVTDASLRCCPPSKRRFFQNQPFISHLCSQNKTPAHGRQTWFLETQAFFICSPKWLTRAFIFSGVGPKQGLMSFVEQVGGVTSKAWTRRKMEERGPELLLQEAGAMVLCCITI